MTTVKSALREALSRLQQHEQPQLDAEVLLAHALQKPRSYLHAWPDAELSAAQAQHYAELIRKRAAGHPVAHLTGHREFWSLDFEVSPDTLIPRPETELLVERTLALLPADRPLAVADLGTGSGAIAIALANERSAWTVCAVDRSRRCLGIARGNAQRLCTDRVSFIHGDWCNAFADASLDAVVANPPYVAARDPHLNRGDVRFEPMGALVAGDTGLDDLQRLIGQTPRVLKSGARLLMEHAPEQREALHKLLKEEGFYEVRTETDLAGLARVTTARRRP